ncbi:hypothetical protein [Clostridium baratii]|uniref:Transcriptional regulator n=1 Tax=Clostridium baratii TaxID=1561 RepID=A0A174V783_9CLOT|nr:hypothetical protein [Clostridium baratii]CUQ30614.1 transcriptional regulator [Clostridium baratii]
MLNKSKVKDLYLKGYNATEIAAIYEATKCAVQKCIQRNTNDSDLKIHKKNRMYMKSAERVIDRTNKRSISDNQLLKWNRQSFTTEKETGDINYNEDCIAPYDLPLKFKNLDKKEYEKTFRYSNKNIIYGSI